MTHAQDKIPELPFSDDAIQQLGDALSRYASTWETDRHDQLRRALERLCTQAHDARVGPEKLLVVVKSAWSRVLSNQKLDATRARVAFDRVVGFCLDAYYQA